MQRDDRLAGPWATGDLGDALGGGADRFVLVLLDRRDDVAHLAAAAAGQRSEEGAVADDDEVGGRLGDHEVVLDPDDSRATALQHPAPDHAVRVGRSGPVEGRGRGGPPVDDERLVLGVTNPEPADVPHLAVVLAVPAVMSEGRGVQVETAEDEPFVLGVEAVPSPGGVVDERVAFEQTGELLVAQVATARGAASGQAVPLDLSGPP